MFEPEVWKMVRTLERDHTDRDAYWRGRLADERRLAKRLMRLGRGRRLQPRQSEGSGVTFGRAVPGRGG